MSVEEHVRGKMMEAYVTTGSGQIGSDSSRDVAQLGTTGYFIGQ